MYESEDKQHETESPQVVEVIPIMKGLPKAALTYFYRGEIKEGEFVDIEVRSSPVLAIVSKVRDVREVRSALKNSPFALKKLTKKKAGHGTSRAFILASERVASFYATTTGAVLGRAIPKLFLTEPDLLCFNFSETERTNREPVVIQLEKKERYAAYRSIIRENFARKNSVLVVLPSNELARRAYEYLSAGIEDYTLLFTLDQNKKIQKEVLHIASKETHPIVFITTPSGLVFNRRDLSTIILDEENSKGYKTRTKPFFSYKKLIEIYAKISSKELVLGDTVLSLETLKKEKAGHYSELVPLKWRVTEAAETKLVDMKKIKDETGEFEIFSPDMKSLVSRALNEERQIFLFGSRKGLSSSTVCGDCGNILTCKNCGAPVVLHKNLPAGRQGADENVYVCHACGAMRSPLTRCDNCNSWKLVTLGIGIERISDEARKLWPKADVYLFDKDHVKDARTARTLAKKIKSDGSAIIIGTELYAMYRDSIDYAGIISLDSLFAIPDFSVHERVFALITKIREMTERELIVQTRNIGKDIILQAARGNILDFYKSEIEDRKAFSYPPFAIFVKVLTEAKEESLGKIAGLLKVSFEEWNPEFMKRRSDKPGVYILSMIIRFEREAWPEKDVVRKLSLLGPEFLIKVDPESIL
jgi:primosomal protein N'